MRWVAAAAKKNKHRALGFKNNATSRVLLRLRATFYLLSHLRLEPILPSTSVGTNKIWCSYKLCARNFWRWSSLKRFSNDIRRREGKAELPWKAISPRLHYLRVYCARVMFVVAQTLRYQSIQIPRYGTKCLFVYSDGCVLILPDFRQIKKGIHSLAKRALTTRFIASQCDDTGAGHACSNGRSARWPCSRCRQTPAWTCLLVYTRDTNM